MIVQSVYVVVSKFTRTIAGIHTISDTRIIEGPRPWLLKVSNFEQAVGFYRGSIGGIHRETDIEKRGGREARTM